MDKKLFILLVAITFVFFGCQKKTASPITYAQKVQKNYSKYSSMYLTWKFKIKPQASNDTFKITYKAWVVRNDDDTILNGLVETWNSYDSAFTFYANGAGYIVSPKKKHITVYPKKYAKYAVIGYGSKLFEYFLKPISLFKLIIDSAQNHIRIVTFDTTIDNHNYVALKLFLPNSEDVTHHTQTIIINPNDNIIQGIIYKKYVVNDWLYAKAWLQTYKFNTVSSKQITSELNKFLKSYKIDTLSTTEQEYQLLPNGSQAPIFDGVIYQTGQKFSFDKANAKIFVLDFWYQSCHPCMRAIPYLVDLYNKYHNDGLLVLGINSIDNTKERSKYLKKFIQAKKITYPIIMVSRSVDASYKVPGYPTIYILNSNKRVVYSEIGFDPKTKLTKVDSIVQVLLKK